MGMGMGSLVIPKQTSEAKYITEMRIYGLKAKSFYVDAQRKAMEELLARPTAEIARQLVNPVATTDVLDSILRDVGRSPLAENQDEARQDLVLAVRARAQVEAEQKGAEVAKNRGFGSQAVMTAMTPTQIAQQAKVDAWIKEGETREERQKRADYAEKAALGLLPKELPWWLVWFGPQEMGVGIFWDILPAGMAAYAGARGLPKGGPITNSTLGRPPGSNGIPSGTPVQVGPSRSYAPGELIGRGNIPLEAEALAGFLRSRGLSTKDAAKLAEAMNMAGLTAKAMKDKMPEAVGLQGNLNGPKRPAARPVFEVDWADPDQRAWAENWWQAQQAGHPKVLTWEPSLSETNRAAAQAEVKGSIPNFRARVFAGKAPNGIGSPDEYPPNATREAGPGSWVGHVPRAANSNQGGRLRQWVKSVGLKPGDQFEIRIINRPKNPSSSEMPKENR
jgi:hypothetical protein